MGVGADDMNKAFRQPVLNHLARRPTAGIGDTVCRKLDLAPKLDELAHQNLVANQLWVSIGVSQHGRDRSANQIGYQWPDIEEQAVRLFDQHEILPGRIGCVRSICGVQIRGPINCKQLARIELRQCFWSDHDFRPWDQLQRAIDGVQFGLHFRDRTANVIRCDLGPAFVLVRQSGDRSDALVPSLLAHRQSVVHIPWPIVEAGAKVAVSIGEHIFLKRQ